MTDGQGEGWMDKEKDVQRKVGEITLSIYDLEDFSRNLTVGVYTEY